MNYQRWTSPPEGMGVAVSPEGLRLQDREGLSTLQVAMAYTLQLW